MGGYCTCSCIAPTFEDLEYEDEDMVADFTPPQRQSRGARFLAQRYRNRFRGKVSVNAYYTSKTDLAHRMDESVRPRSQRRRTSCVWGTVR